MSHDNPPATVTVPWGAATDTFEGHFGAEEAFGKMNCFFFVVGAILNTFVCWSIIKGRIRSPVDVCVILISVSNWITILMDLFVGISYVNNRKPMAFGSHEFTQFWGFLKFVNHEWLAALVALLGLSNVANRSKLFIFLAGVGWLVFESVMMAIPLTMGAMFLYFTFVPHPLPVYDDFLGGYGAYEYMVWLFLTEFIPYVYCYMTTAAIMLVNIILYSELKKGYVESSPKKIQDTMTCISYSAFYLLLDFPEVTQHLFWLTQLVGIDCDRFYEVRLMSFFAVLFTNTFRATVYPLVYLVAMYGTGVVTYPTRKALTLFREHTNYRRFYGEEEHVLQSDEDIEDTV